MGTIAAPLLAGFAFAAIGLVLQVQSSLRWPDQALVLLVLAFSLLLFSVQASFHARRHYVPPSELMSYLSLASNERRRRQLRGEYLSGLGSYERWEVLAMRSYNVAIVMLLMATAVLLVPRGQVGAWRLVACIGALAAAVAEVAWMVRSEAARHGGTTHSGPLSPEDSAALVTPQVRPSSNHVTPSPPASD